MHTRRKKNTARTRYKTITRYAKKIRNGNERKI